MKTREERFDSFQYWLMDMRDALSHMHDTLPKEISEKLDYSVKSLDILEHWILEQYPTTQAILAQQESRKVDGYARYVGETFRKYLGGKWIIELDNPKHAFYNLPEIKSEFFRDCPLSFVIASTDRRTGHYISDILKNFIDS
ncbi:hypothetical protein [Acinetobacter haemolyticus]|uniref:hypothetical protein n=1 Tax=Acinetobacter haemolyticus TaxID=29430 RepID=UPI003F57075F